jgi:hypothetical protein
MITPYLGCKIDLSKEKNKVKNYLRNVYRFEKSFECFEDEITAPRKIEFLNKTYVILCEGDNEINECFFRHLKSNKQNEIKIEKIKSKHGYEANKKSLPIILRVLNENRRN